MNQTPAHLESEQPTVKRQVNFRDENHALHLQVFLEWLPDELHEVPYIHWERLPSMVMAYLVNTVGNSPFAPNMALAAGIRSESMHHKSTIYRYVASTYTLLRQVQAVCDIQSARELTKEVWELVVAKSGVAPSFYDGFKRYRTVTERDIPGYLEQLTPQQRTQITHALLPRLPYHFVQQHFSASAFRDEQQQRRKDKSDVLAPLHTVLVAIVRFRKQAAERMFLAFQGAKEQVHKGEAALPLPFSYEEELIIINQQATTIADIRLAKRSVSMSFRLWDHRQWVIEHANDYAPSYVSAARLQRDEFASSVAREFFVEFLGPAEHLLWIGDIVRYGLWQANTPLIMPSENIRHRRELLENLGVVHGLSCTRDGLLTPSMQFTKRLASALSRTGALVFDPESLYRGTLYAAALVTLALTNGSRMAELLQVSADRFKIRPYTVSRAGCSPEERRILHLQWLLPKGKYTEEQRKLFLISDGAYQLLGEIAQGLRETHHGRIPVVRFHPDAKKVGDPPPERYLFQWGASSDGQWGALRPSDAQSLLRFILYGLEFRTKQGEPFSVTTHLLRHVMATAARHEHEVSPTAVARALHHEHRPGVIPEATEYYSQETGEQSLIDLAEFQTSLEEHATSILIRWPDEQELKAMDEELRESFERWHTLLETTLGFCGNVDLCPRGYNRTLCIGCPHLVPDPRKRQIALHWRTAYAQLAEELEAQGNTVDARQYHLLVCDLDTHINEMAITQASIEDGTRKPVFLQLPSAKYDAVVIDAEA